MSYQPVIRTFSLIMEGVGKDYYTPLISYVRKNIVEDGVRCYRE